jgi:DNA-binding CsgD family transcriptional regulator
MVKDLTEEMKGGRAKEKQLLKWRRAHVLELSSQGFSDKEISNKLQVSPLTIYRDLRHLRKQAQDNLQHHIHETLPEEYQKCMVGIKTILKNTLHIAETVSDPGIKLQANNIAKDCYKFILDMSTNAGVVSDAMKYVVRQTEEVNVLQKLGKIEEEQTAISGIY